MRCRCPSVTGHLWTRRRHIHQIRPMNLGAGHGSQLILVVEPAAGHAWGFQSGQQTGLGAGRKKLSRELLNLSATLHQR